MKRLFGLGSVLVVASFFLVYGCGHRGRVAGKKILAEVDEFLGKEAVRREEIASELKGISKQMQAIRENRARDQARIELIDEKIVGAEEYVARLDSGIGKLRDMLQRAEPVQIGGKTYSVDAQKDMSFKVLSARADAEKFIKKQKKQRAVRESKVAERSKRLQVLEPQLAMMRERLDEIDDGIREIEASRNAGSNGADTSLSEKMRQLTRKTDELWVDVRAKTILANDVPTGKGNDVEPFLKDIEQPKDLIAEMNKILAGTKK